MGSEGPEIGQLLLPRMESRNVSDFWRGRARKTAWEGKRIFGPHLRAIFLLVGSPLPKTGPWDPQSSRLPEGFAEAVTPGGTDRTLGTCHLSPGTLHGNRRLSLTPGDRIPDFQDKESQMMGIRDPIPKATRTRPTGFWMHYCSHCAPAPHFICNISAFKAHMNRWHYHHFIGNQDWARSRRFHHFLTSSKAWPLPSVLSWFQEAERWMGRLVPATKQVKADICAPAFRRQQTQGWGSRALASKQLSLNASRSSELAKWLG